MKRRNYIVMMIVGVVAIAFAVVTPCNAGWSYLGSSVSSGLPDSDWDQGRGSNSWWYWDYDVTNIDRGGDYYGSWAHASFDTKAEAYVYSFTSESTSVSTYPIGYPGPCVYGTSEYLNQPPYDPNAIYEYYVSASGYVEVEGQVDDSNIAPTDTLYCSSSAYADAQGYEDGYGWASGSVSENSTGSADADVGGIASWSSAPTITQTSGYYYAYLEFTVSVDDDGEEPIYLYAPAYLEVYVDAYASISSSLGYEGSADGKAWVGFGGECSVSVTLP
jgi:hypothetical protein